MRRSQLASMRIDDRQPTREYHRFAGRGLHAASPTQEHRIKRGKATHRFDSAHDIFEVHQERALQCPRASEGNANLPREQDMELKSISRPMNGFLSALSTEDF